MRKMQHSALHGPLRRELPFSRVILSRKLTRRNPARNLEEREEGKKKREKLFHPQLRGDRTSCRGGIRVSEMRLKIKRRQARQARPSNESSPGRLIIRIITVIDVAIATSCPWRRDTVRNDGPVTSTFTFTDRVYQARYR
ncbi:hypothetical protein HN011_004315 [Eciton burchellii]|nr:hypothetical protein HN011_004315 [Eciton burchellii]